MRTLQIKAGFLQMLKLAFLPAFGGMALITLAAATPLMYVVYAVAIDTLGAGIFKQIVDVALSTGCVQVSPGNHEIRLCVVVELRIQPSRSAVAVFAG